jgi:hypothetical protein
MPRKLLLIAKRLLLFALITTLTWFTLFKAFPFIDDWLPWGFAILATYGLFAYIGLPVTLRIWQAVQRPTHVPTRTIAADGWAVDPINIVVVAHNDRDFIWAMQKAGWLQADDNTLKNKLRFIYATIFNKPYPNAPFGTYYVFGRKQDLGFQIPVGKSPRHRHHVRFWRVGSTLLDNDHEHQGFWRKLLKKFINNEKQIWVGAAILDRGINIRWRNLQLDHSVEGNTTIERDFLTASLREASVLKDSIDIRAGEPLHTRHQGFGEKIIADGYVTLCEIKRQILPPVLPGGSSAETPQKKPQ